MKVLVCDPIAEEGVEFLKKHAEVDVKLKQKPEELLAIIGDYDAVVVRSETKITAEAIRKAGRLLAIGRAGIGVDNIDVEAATQRGIVVVNAPTGNTIAAAEHAVAMMLALARHIPQACATLKSGVWERGSFVGTELRNKTLGIVGLGNVGSEVTRRVQGFQMRVIAYDPFVSPEYTRNLGVEPVSLDELLKTSDFVTFHLPLTESTRGLMGKKQLSMVKPSVRLVNCARGGLIDEKALLQAIREGKVAGAAMDVFATEPDTGNPLFESDRVIVTPHLGASTEEAQSGVAVDVAEQIVEVLEGRPAKYAVNAPFISAEVFPVLAPYLKAASMLGRLAAQLTEGQMSELDISYEGDVSEYDTAALKAGVIGGLLEMTTEERVNLVNAEMMAQRRGLKVTEHKSRTCENYSSLMTVRATTSVGEMHVGGSVMRGETHIVRINNYWFDLAQTEGYFLFIDHRDRPGLIGAVGTIAGKADVNISFMELSRLQARGPALMVLALDEPLGDQQCQEIMGLSDIHSVKMVRL
jgi:D-3-phosphoglycerate dehydrogenase